MIGLSPEQFRDIAQGRGLSPEGPPRRRFVKREYLALSYAIPLVVIADAAVVTVALTPSSVEVSPQIDASTVRLSFTPQAVEIFELGAAAFAVKSSRPPILIPGPWPKTEVWTVVHYDHADNPLGDCNPTDPEFAIYLNKVGYLNYTLDASHPLATEGNTEPFATDFKLFRGKNPIIGGIHTSISIGDVEEHQFQVSGKDWLQYLDGRFWPFDPSDPTGNLYFVTDTDTYTVVKNLLDEILAQPNSPTFNYNFGLLGNLIDFKIEPSDTETILGKITTLGQRNPGSFDFEITHDRIINLYAPRKGVLKDLVLEQGSNIYKLSYTNNGPTGTHVLVTAHVTSAQAGAIIDHPNIAKYRRWDTSVESADIADATQIDAIAAGEADRAATPHTEFTCTVVPDFVDDLLSQVTIGDSVHVQGWLHDYKYIDEDLRLVSIAGRPGNEGDEEYELGLDDGTITL